MMLAVWMVCAFPETLVRTETLPVLWVYVIVLQHTSIKMDSVVSTVLLSLSNNPFQTFQNIINLSNCLHASNLSNDFA